MVLCSKMDGLHCDHLLKWMAALRDHLCIVVVAVVLFMVNSCTQLKLKLFSPGPVVDVRRP
ncbi:MAG: hypothetical protein KDI30_00230 [Pseudomonadales bacterium]|nr:hypothetical protein [Pseudomonadales bacterium]